MNWNEALELIVLNITVGLHLDPQLPYRYVIEGPNYHCNNYNYDGENGYRVTIGANQDVEIPFSMLESLYLATINNNNIYNNQVFGEHYAQQLNNHGCHVHVVGKIFEIAGLVHQINAQNYQIY